MIGYGTGGCRERIRQVIIWKCGWGFRYGRLLVRSVYRNANFRKVEL